MKVRIGIALGQWPIQDHSADAILDLIDYFEALDVDSLWVSDRLVSSALILEPVTFLAYIAGRLRKMKLGTSTLVLPTRNLAPMRRSVSCESCGRKKISRLKENFIPCKTSRLCHDRGRKTVCRSGSAGAAKRHCAAPGV